MEITAALAADLTILTQALDDPDSDVVESVLRLARDVGSAVPSFLGLTVTVHDSDPPFTFTTLEDHVGPGHVRTSLMMALSHDAAGARVIVYAGTPGAFVDLAADLSWLARHTLAGCELDQHLILPAIASPAANLHAVTAVNQAIGVLIGAGLTPEAAHRELEVRAATTDTDRLTAARVILAALPGNDRTSAPGAPTAV